MKRIINLNLYRVALCIKSWTYKPFICPWSNSAGYKNV